jgi:hypothetical protein
VSKIVAANDEVRSTGADSNRGSLNKDGRPPWRECLASDLDVGIGIEDDRLACDGSDGQRGRLGLSVVCVLRLARRAGWRLGFWVRSWS